MTSPCSCPCPLNLSITPTRAAGLAVGTGATIAWYALPDVVRSRPLRGLVKVGLLGAMGWSLVSLMPEGDELPPYDDEMDCSEAKTEDPLDGVTEAEPRELAVLAGAVLGSAVVTVAVERWLFRRGERRRAAGVRLAHTRQGLALGVLEAVATVATLAGEGRGSCPTGA
ncbi:peptidase S9 [Pauljensenia sp. 20925_1_25]|uniref:peptidase S9 n=1 Tax=Pauljensenia sp. 20925_1_25 TaxID=3003692 RepID=UPI00352C56AD